MNHIIEQVSKKFKHKQAMDNIHFKIKLIDSL